MYDKQCADIASSAASYIGVRVQEGDRASRAQAAHAAMIAEAATLFKDLPPDPVTGRPIAETTPDGFRIGSRVFAFTVAENGDESVRVSTLAGDDVTAATTVQTKAGSRPMSRFQAVQVHGLVNRGEVTELFFPGADQDGAVTGALPALVATTLASEANARRDRLPGVRI